jgi:endonuclease YncB( thermonuclease family)
MIQPQYRAKFISNHDGDTIKVSVDLGFKVWLHDITLRLLDVDCPELRGKEIEAGRLAKQFVFNELVDAKEIYIYTVALDSFGRWLSQVWYLTSSDDLINLNSELIAKGHAIQYVR